MTGGESKAEIHRPPGAQRASLQNGGYTLARVGSSARCGTTGDADDYRRPATYSSVAPVTRKDGTRRNAGRVVPSSLIVVLIGLALVLLLVRFYGGADGFPPY